jgi:hypothetical protein
METRRLYITSRDSKPRTQFNDKVSIDFSKAHLGCESNQLLGISIIRATLPPTLEAVPRTILKSVQGNDKNVSKISISANVGGVAIVRVLYFNDWNNLNSGLYPASVYTNTTWTVQTTPSNIIQAINSAVGSELLGLSTLESSNRIHFVSTTAGDSITFVADTSSPAILKALGVFDDEDTVFNYTTANDKAPYSFDFANLLPVVFVRTNVGISGFMSRGGGTTENILGSIPITIDNLNAGNTVSSFQTATQSETYQPSSSINYVNFANVGGHKIISNHHINTMELELINHNGVIVGSGLNDYNMTLELKTYD